MADNTEQELFLQKTLLVDERGRTLPQYYDPTTGIFLPITNAEEYDNSLLNQELFLTKKLILDSRGHAIPQFYDPESGSFFPVTTNGAWSNWTLSAVELLGRGTPVNNVTSFFGSKYRDIDTNIEYINTGAKNALSIASWQPIIGTTTAAVSASVGLTNVGGIVTGTVTKQGLFTRLDFQMVNGPSHSQAANTPFNVAIIPVGFRPLVRAAKVFVEDNAANASTPRQYFTINGNGNVTWTPTVATAYLTMNFSVLN